MKAKLYHKLPSEVFGEEDALAAWMLDTCVTWFGITVENALQETVEVGLVYDPQARGNNKRREAKYTLSQLLDSDFRLPRPAPPRKAQSGLASLMAMAGRPGSGVKHLRYVGPQEGH